MIDVLTIYYAVRYGPPYEPSLYSHMAALQAVADAAYEDSAKACEDKANNHGWSYDLPSVGQELAHNIRALKGKP